MQILFSLGLLSDQTNGLLLIESLTNSLFVKNTIWNIFDELKVKPPTSHWYKLILILILQPQRVVEWEIRENQFTNTVSGT